MCALDMGSRVCGFPFVYTHGYGRAIVRCSYVGNETRMLFGRSLYSQVTWQFTKRKRVFVDGVCARARVCVCVCVQAIHDFLSICVCAACVCVPARVCVCAEPAYRARSHVWVL